MSGNVYTQSVDNGITSLKVSVYKIPLEFPESDGTLEWDSTTIVIVEIDGCGVSGIGYTYGSQAIASVIENDLKHLVIGKNCFQIESTHALMIEKIRNNGNCGIAYMAISAVDIALWDLKARLLNLSLASLLGRARNSISIYGSGGFTSYSHDQLQQQFGNLASQGIKHMKMKVGRNPGDDPLRVKIVREAIGTDCALFVDANGAYSPKQALRKAWEFKKYEVSWFEEPISSDNLQGLRFIKEHVPPGMNIAAGEYGYNLSYFSRMLGAESVDILQADITRCGGVTGFVKAGHLCEAKQIPLSSHCAPALHLHVGLSLPAFYIAEYFYDHVLVENIFFDGIVLPVNGQLSPQSGTLGLGLQLRKADVEKYRIR